MSNEEFENFCGVVLAGFPLTNTESDAFIGAVRAMRAELAATTKAFNDVVLALAAEQRRAMDLQAERDEARAGMAEVRAAYPEAFDAGAFVGRSDAPEVVRLRAEVLSLIEHASNGWVRTADLTEEVASLRAIIAGRTTPPTDAEIAAHEQRGGSWLAAVAAYGVYLLAGTYAAIEQDREGIGLDPVVHWWSLDENGTPCEWPGLP